MEFFISNYLDYLNKTENNCLYGSFKAVADTIMDVNKAKNGKNTIDDLAKLHMSCIFIKRVFDISKEEWKKEKKIFTDFNSLSVNLLNSTLKDKDKANIIFWIIERNLSTGIAESDFDREIIGIDDIGSCEKSMIIYNQLKEKVDNAELTPDDLLDALFDIENKNLKKEEIAEYIASPIKNLYNLALNHKIIKENYYDKVDTFTNDDIMIIVKALSELDIPEKMCNIIEKSLISKLEKRRIQSNKKEYVVVEKEKKEHRSYNEIQQELLQYYDYSKNEMTIDRRITLDEIIGCVSLLSEIGAHKEELYTFIKTAMFTNNQYKINPINLYNEQYYRMEYYKEKLGLQTEFQNLQDLYQELFLLGGQDYEDGKAMLRDDLCSFMKYIPNNSDYEIISAKKLSKSKKGH